ncbi:hypothetical protein C9E85_10980 [Plesiomonas shigelloides]|nr:hypothetical protein C9E85_10980 [Plesiomonas shigelloides]
MLGQFVVVLSGFHYTEPLPLPLLLAPLHGGIYYFTELYVIISLRYFFHRPIQLYGDLIAYVK